MRRLLPDDSPRSLARATGLGAASSSCSYAAVALARSLFRRGADFTAAIAFEIASTNLVFELGIVIALLLGWEFVVGEFVGGPLMIILVAVAFRLFLQRRLVDEAREQANRGLVGSMEGHAEMDMSAGGEGIVVAAPPHAARPHRHLRLLRHGLGGDLAATSASASSSPARSPRGCRTRGGSRSSWSTTRPPRSSGGR